MGKRPHSYKKTMKTIIPTAVLLTVTLAAANISGPAKGLVAPGNPQRGRYLVESIAMCGQCHTPRDGRGDMIRSQWLKGATIPVSNPLPDKPWAEFAPRIAGLPQYSDEQALRLLTDGIARTGTPLRNPMPPFRMSAEDARDVIAYLRSQE